MASAVRSRGWWSVLASLGAGIVATCTALGAVYPVAKDHWLSRGQVEERQDIIYRLQLIAESAPREQRDLIGRLIQSFTRDLQDRSATEPAKAAAERQAQEWASIIRSVDPRTYMPPGQAGAPAVPIIEIQAGQTALICDGRHTVTFSGPRSSLTGRFDVMLDGSNWITGPGERRQFRQGVALTMMEITPSAARVLTACE